MFADEDPLRYTPNALPQRQIKHTSEWFARPHECYELIATQS